LGRDEDNNNGDSNVNINADSADDSNSADDNSSDDENNDSNSDSGLSLNYGGAPSFDTDLNGYGNGRRTFQETGFTHVTVAGGYRVVVRHGDGFKIEAAGEDQALNDLRVEREGNELIVKPRNAKFFGGDWGRRNRKTLIRIEMPAIEQLSLAGAVQGDLGGFDRQDNLRIEQAGASHLRLNGNYGTLRLEQAGVCRTTATGQADQLELDAAGACELAAANLKVRDGKVTIAGACKARLNVTESLKGDAVGASEIAYSGQPASVKVDATGPSSIKRL